MKALSFPRSILAAVLLATVLPVWLITPFGGTATAAGTATISGARTTWRISVVRARFMDKIPDTTWKNAWRFRNFHFVVLTLSVTNLGHTDAAPYDDLGLVLAEHVGTTNTTPGWSPLVRTVSPFQTFFVQAAKHFGGVVPWTITPVHQTRIYSVVFAVIRGEQHYGIFNFDATKGYTFLLDSGV